MRRSSGIPTRRPARHGRGRRGRRLRQPPGRLQPRWNDEFNDNQLDRAKWCTRYIYGGGPPLQVPDPACQRNGDGNLDFLNDEQQRYVDTNRNGEAMHVEGGGTLSLRATRTRTDDSWATYESAMIRSKATFRPTASTSYYVTARVRMPDVVGTWPALWLNSDRRPDGSTTWPPEIDILEGAYNGRDDRADMLHQATIIRGRRPPAGTGVHVLRPRVRPDVEQLPRPRVVAGPLDRGLGRVDGEQRVLLRRRLPDGVRELPLGRERRAAGGAGPSPAQPGHRRELGRPVRHRRRQVPDVARRRLGRVYRRG